MLYEVQPITVCKLDLIDTVRHLIQKFFVEQEFSQCALCGHHFVECGDLSGEIALTVILFFQEFASQVVDKLNEKSEEKKIIP